MRCSTSVRTVPSSSATTLDPSLITTELIWRSRLRIKLEDDARDLDIIAGLEAGRLERTDHTEPTQAALEVLQGVLVVEVVARDQLVDALALDDVDPLVVLDDA